MTKKIDKICQAAMFSVYATEMFLLSQKMLQQSSVALTEEEYQEFHRIISFGHKMKEKASEIIIQAKIEENP